MLKAAFLFFLVFSKMACASDMDDDFQQGLDAGALHQKQAGQALKNFSPNTVFSNFNSKPPESDYFSGGTQTSEHLKEDAAVASPNTEVGSAVNESLNVRPQFPVDMASPEMKHSTLIQDNAVDIVNGISNQFVDCTKQRSCTTTYENKTCEETPKKFNQSCKKTLVVTMVPKQTDTHYKFTAHLQAASHDYAAIIFNLVNGAVLDKGPSDASGSLVGRLPADVSCHGLHGTVTAVRSSARPNLNYVYFPSCTNGLTLNYRFSSSSKINVDMDVDIVESKMTQVPEGHWEDTCGALANNKGCTLQSDTCLEADTLHTIDGTPLFESCWEKEDIYACRGGGTAGACQTLIEAGCQQTASVCIQQDEAGCSRYQQTFRCPTKSCTDNSVVCNGKTYCLTEDCMEHTKVSDSDFQKAVSALSAVNAAAKSFDQQSIFTGTPESCSSEPIGFSNCCKDSGWGIDINLTKCTDEEKALGKAKEEKQTVYVGSYCDKNTLGVCVVHKKSYCVFPSVLDRIVQEQGRGQQLHVPFGEAEGPDCRGITPEELQKINFNLIDFSDFYADIENETKVENTSAIEQRMANDMGQMAGGAP